MKRLLLKRADGTPIGAVDTTRHRLEATPGPNTFVVKDRLTDIIVASFFKVETVEEWVL